MMNHKTICIAVFTLAFTAAGVVFAQTNEESTESITSEIESAADDAEESVIPENTAAEPPKKNREKNDNSAAPKKAKDKEAAEETRFKVEGLVEVGFDLRNREYKDPPDTRNRVIGRGEVEMSARPVKKVRAELGIEYNVNDTFIVVDKMYGQYNVTKDGTVRAGLMKKSFGLEERAGVDERYFHRRSIVNDELEELGFLEHDLTLQYRHDIDSTWRFSAGASWSRDTASLTVWERTGGQTVKSDELEDTMSYLHNYSVQYTPNDSMIFVLAAVVKHLDRISAATFASSFSFWHNAQLFGPFGIQSEAEVTFGSRRMADKELVPLLENGVPVLDEEYNPVSKLIYTHYDRNILGVRVQERFPITLENAKILRQIIPVAEWAGYWNDLDSDGFRMQMRLGLTFGFAKNSAFQFRNTYGRIWDSVDGKMEVREYRWDSEVVVIF